MRKDYNLTRFIDAHKMNFENALKEIKNGKKNSHWMWYIFPQIKGLGKSSIADYYAIKNLDEAKAYLNNEYLKDNTMKIVKALLELAISDPTQIFDSPDDLKLRSSMTLFHYAEPTETLFTEVLNKFYGGNFDRRTITILKKDNGNTL